MVRLVFSVELKYDVAPPGCDFIFNIHAAHTRQQRVVTEMMELGQFLLPQVHTDPSTGNRYMRLRAEPGPLRLRYSATVELQHHVAAPELIPEVPVTWNSPEMTALARRAAEAVVGTENIVQPRPAMGSEDFASFTYELPCAYLLLGAGTPQEDPRYGKPMHNEAVVFNEDVLPTGAALHTLFALRMLAQET